MNILNYLDRELENFKIKTGEYPNKIIMSKDTKDKIFESLELEPDLSNCWKNYKDNFRGIEIEIREGIFIELE